ncbi:MAG: DUF5672 family protein [Verrucomicrobiae bacterium]
MPNVSCVQIEALFPDRAARVLNWCAKCCRFEDVILFSPRPPLVPFVGRWVQIPKFGYVGYSTFSTKCLHYYVKSEFALVTQHDGFIIHPENWREEFLDFDYIGAPWPECFGEERVGNSGFSFRSRAFMQACADISIAHNNEADEPQARRYQKRVDEAADDIWMCKNTEVREAMARAGIEYAPLDVAKYFASEMEIEEITFDDKEVFGFHDFSRRPEREEYKKLVAWEKCELPTPEMLGIEITSRTPSRQGKWGR